MAIIFIQSQNFQINMWVFINHYYNLIILILLYSIFSPFMLFLFKFAFFNLDASYSILRISESHSHLVIT